MDDWDDFDPHVLYRIYDGFDRPLYFGETNDLSRRLKEHQEKAWFRRTEITIKLTMFPNRAEALAAESRAIATEKPWHNKAGLKPPKRPVPVITPAPERAPEARPAAKQVKPRDLLSDLDQVLGNERVRLSALPHLLRQLAPLHEPYQTLTRLELRDELKRKGVRVTNTGNVLRLDPADLRCESGVLPLN